MEKLEESIVSPSSTHPTETPLTSSQSIMTSSVTFISSFTTQLSSSQHTLPFISSSNIQLLTSIPETAFTSSQSIGTDISSVPFISSSTIQSQLFFIDETLLASSQPTVTSSVLPIISSSSIQPIEIVLTSSQPTATSSVPFVSQPIMISSVLLTSSVLLNSSPPPIESSSVPFTSSPTIQPTMTSSILLITSTYQPMETESEVIQLASTEIDSALVGPVETSIELKTSSSAYQSLEISSDVLIPSSSVSPHETNVAPELCGSGGGWTRLAYLNMSDATQNCPSGFRLYQSGGVRACGRPVTNNGSCVSVQFPSNGISYSQICGRVTGYQYATPDAFSESVNNINSYYLEGVSITRGSPRQHVWSLSAGVSSNRSNSVSVCPCTGGTSPQSFVGNNYFCESGNNASTWSRILYTSDPLWDGQGCNGLESSCCDVPGIPWFHRDYGNTTTTDYIELRVCGSEGTSNEDSPLGFYMRFTSSRQQLYYCSQLQ